MRRKLIPAVCGALIIMGFGWLLSQQNPEDAKFAKIVDTYLDSYWKFYPTAATLAGYYKFNDKLEDFSESTIERYLDGLDKFSAEILNKIAKDKLSPDVQIDLDVLRDAIELDMLKLEKIVPQQFNPMYYNEIILENIRGLLLKDFAPLDARLKSATERAKLLPGFIKAAKDNLKTPPKEYTEAAIKRSAAILDYYKNDVPKLIEGASAEAKSKFQAEWAKVIVALEDYRKFLEGELLARSTGNFRLREAHQRLFQLTSGGLLTFNEILERAKIDTENLRREMLLVCIPYYKIMDPRFDIEHPPSNMSQDRIRNSVIPHVLNKIKNLQPAKEEWLAKIKATVDDVKAFIDKTQLLEKPQDPLAIELMPPVDRGGALARLVVPGPYEQGGSYTLLINPYPESLPVEQAQDFMDEYTNYLLPIWTIQKVYPGSFFPAAFTLKNASLLRKLHPNQALLQGWPLYVQDMFVSAGYNNYELRQRLSELKLKLRALIDFQVDIQVQESNLTKDQAIRLMTIMGFETQAEAERKWDYIVLNPGQASYAYIGYQSILDMEEEYKKTKGDAFSQKEFLQKLLSFGPLPLRILRTKLSP
jgi:hypothetical protein